MRAAGMARLTSPTPISGGRGRETVAGLVLDEDGVGPVLGVVADVTMAEKSAR